MNSSSIEWLREVSVELMKHFDRLDVLGEESTD
jgi:hypothetical protein